MTAGTRQTEGSFEELRAEVARLHSWPGVMSLLDEHYPADVFTGESGDPGARVVALAHEVDRRGKMIEELAAKVHRLADRNEELRKQLTQAHGLSTGARTAVAALRSENERLRAQRATALVLAKDWVHGTTTLAKSPQPDIAARALTLQSAATELRAALGVES